MLDTGSSRNYVTKTLINRLKMPTQEDKSLEILVANNAKLIVIQTLILTFMINKFNPEFKIKCYVLNKCPVDMIIGNEFIMNNDCIFNLQIIIF